MSTKSTLVLVVLCFIGLSNANLFGQVDNQTWNGVQAVFPLENKMKIAVKPIVRTFNNVVEYQNSSIDVALSFPLEGQWSAAILWREWFVPEQPARRFFWFDINNVGKYNFGTIKNRLRYHLALDIHDRNDPDYVRWNLHYQFPVKGKIIPFFNIETWFRTNGSNKVERMRYEPGITWKIIKDLKLSFVFRRQETVNLDPGSKQNQFVTTLVKTFNTIKTKE